LAALVQELDEESPQLLQLQSGTFRFLEELLELEDLLLLELNEERLELDDGLDELPVLEDGDALEDDRVELEGRVLLEDDSDELEGVCVLDDDWIELEGTVLLEAEAVELEDPPLPMSGEGIMNYQLRSCGDSGEKTARDEVQTTQSAGSGRVSEPSEEGCRPASRCEFESKSFMGRSTFQQYVTRNDSCLSG